MRGLIAVIAICSILLVFNNYIYRTQTEPKPGGKYTEGLLGQPRYINPILSQTNDIDRDLTEIIFSSLFTYDENGNLIPELAENYTISDDGLNYEITLKNNITWHNGEYLTADDVIFTITTIQNKEYESPLRIIWDGIVIEKINDLTIRFIIRNPYVPFLHNLTFGILPKHLWAGISAQNFPLADYNLFNPVGSGPYKFKKIDKDKSGQIKSITLVRNENYLSETFIQTIIFKFYNSQTELIQAYHYGQIDGFMPLAATSQPETKKNTNIYNVNLPIYHAVFFNQTQSKPLSDENVRIALSYATNKQEILEKVLKNKGTIIDSPIFFDWLNTSTEKIHYNYNLEKAIEILQENDWIDQDEDNIRDKEEIKLEIDLITTDWPELVQTAELIQQQWEKVGAKVNLIITDPISIKRDYIQTRNYQALLFGEILGADPDPFAFWHSSQKKDPGLNLSLYQNKDADKLLEDGRQTINIEDRIKKYKEFEKIIIKDAPAVFLYSPTYLYSVDKDIKGIDLKKFPLPSQRFCQIQNWHIKTKRIDK